MKVWLRRGLHVSASVAIICAILALEYRIHGLKSATVNYSLLLAILYFAVRWERLETIIASLVASLGFLYYFESPAGSLKADDPESYIEVGAFLITALVVSQTALRARYRAAEALAREQETERLYELGQAMLAAVSLETTAWIATNQMIRIFGAKGSAFYLKATDEFQLAGDTCEISTDELRAVAKGGGPRFDYQKNIAMLPVDTGEELAGSFGVCGVALTETVLKSISGLLSTVLLRVRASEKLFAANQALEHKHQQVEEQKKVSESLLLNILPAEVADELRVKGTVSPRYFEDVTILFTDFVAFTLSTEKLAAEELVDLLHDYFTAFDQIVARYHLEKLKTIGDSYMCICGLPMRNPAHPVDMVMAAFEMLRAVEVRQQLDRAVKWKVRIGVHTGPVVAGVVGINKFAFDIWGDTVNYSSRMESSGAANRINLSERTYSRVKDFFECEYRGKVATKDHREVDMYFANGILPVLLNGCSQSPPPAFTRRYNVYFQKDPPAFPDFLISQSSSGDVAAVPGA